LKKKGESQRALAKPLFKLKFGVLKVTNQHRDFWKGKSRWHMGNATNLRAKVRLKFTNGSYGDSLELSWYRDDWDLPLRYEYFTDLPSLDEIARRLEEVSVNHNVLMRYFKSETKELVPVDDPAYLWLFFTSEGWSTFTPMTASEYKNYAPKGYMGKGKTGGNFTFKVTIYSEEHTLLEGEYELDMRAWNDFTLTEVKKN
jgi:hypothetical protein